MCGRQLDNGFQPIRAKFTKTEKSHAKTQRRKDEGQNSRKEAQKTQKSDTGQGWF
jgi:hypothetical protein